MPEATFEARKQAALEKARALQQQKLDTETGASPMARALVGGVSKPEDRLATLREFYPNAFANPAMPGNFVFTNPETGRPTVYNPSGLDVGDVASVAREGTQLAGAGLGAVAGAAGGPVGAVAGAGLGGAAGEELFNLGARALGAQDTRTLGERAAETAVIGASEAAGQAGGMALQKGLTAGTKALFRGGEAGRQGVAQTIEDAARFGSDPSVAQATRKAYLDSVEQFLSKAPGSAGHIRKVVKQTTDRVLQQLEAKVQSLAGREVDPEVAGRTLKEGIESEGGFVGRFTETKKALYAEADRLIPDATLVTPLETRGTLQALANKVPDMEALNEFLSGSTVRGLSNAFPPQGPISYGILRQVRTAIGDKLSSFDLVSDIPRGDLKQLYAALSKDLAAAAKTAGPKAEAAARRADRYYKAGISRIDNVLEPLIKNKVPELISASLDRSIAKGGSTIRPVMRSLTAQERRIVSGSIVRRLGSARPSQQGAEGGDFSFETFLTNWNKLDPKAKDAMFGWPELRGTKADLDALARWADNMRESSQAFANPSGTASALVGTTAGFVGLGMGIAGALTGSMSMLATPAILAVGALGTNQAARLMTSRGFVRWLASSTKVKPGGWGSHIGKLAGVAAVEDTETKRSIIDFMTALNQTPSE